MPSRPRGLYTNDRPTPWRPWELGNRQLPITHFAPPVAINRMMSLRCVVCHATFKRDSELKRHRASVHLRRHEYCKKCGKEFTRKDNLTRHVKLAHSNDDKPSCRFCSKSLSRKDAVQRHESTCSKNPVNRSADSARKSDEYTTMSHIERITLKLAKSKLAGDSPEIKNES